MENLTLNSNGRSRSRLAGGMPASPIADSAIGRQRIDHQRQLSALRNHQHDDTNADDTIDVSMLSATEEDERFGGDSQSNSMNGSPDSCCSQSQSGTPSRKMRRANRKNLSLSFDSDEFVEAESGSRSGNENVAAKAPAPATDSAAMRVGAGLCQTDSGFNDVEM